MTQDSLSLPIKISWMINLSQSIESRWSPSVLQKLKKGIYSAEIDWKVLPSESIASIFSPIYEASVMSKADYHIDPKVAFETMEQMSHDSSYKLLWFTSKNNRIVYGGTIIHNLPGIVRVAYRAFDHDLAKTNNLRSLDYYADYILQQYVETIGVDNLSRGGMKHPCDSLGLSIYKFSVGARPLIKPGVELRVFEKKQVFMYYSEPDSLGYFKKATIQNTDISTELLSAFTKLASRHGIEVVVNNNLADLAQ